MCNCETLETISSRHNDRHTWLIFEVVIYDDDWDGMKYACALKVKEIGRRWEILSKKSIRSQVDKYIINRSSVSFSYFERVPMYEEIYGFPKWFILCSERVEKDIVHAHSRRPHSNWNSLVSVSEQWYEHRENGQSAFALPSWTLRECCSVRM